MTVSPWGPFLPGIAADEQKAQLRCLRLAAKLLCGPRGKPAALALLRAELAEGDPDLLAEAAAEIERLSPIDRRRLLSSFAASLPERIAS